MPADPANTSDHACTLREDYAALSEVVHSMHGRLVMLEERMRQLEARDVGKIAFPKAAKAAVEKTTGKG